MGRIGWYAQVGQCFVPELVSCSILAWIRDCYVPLSPAIGTTVAGHFAFCSRLLMMLVIGLDGVALLKVRPDVYVIWGVQIYGLSQPSKNLPQTLVVPASIPQLLPSIIVLSSCPVPDQ